MKTKEFIEKVVKLGYEIEDLEANTQSENIRIINIKSNKGYIARVFTNEMYKFDVNKLDSSFKKDQVWDLLVLILEYTASNLNEREEKKKYRLRVPFDFNHSQYLNINKDKTYYFISDNLECYGIMSSFVQEQIDGMPKAWQDFFIKEEVK